MAVFVHLKRYPIRVLVLHVIHRKRNRHKIDCAYKYTRLHMLRVHPTRKVSPNAAKTVVGTGLTFTAPGLAKSIPGKL